MFFGSIFCRSLRHLVVFENGLKIGVEKGADIVYLDSSLEGDIDEKI